MCLFLNSLCVGKDVEVLKQMYDVASLIQEMDDFELVKETYSRTLKTEIAYRGEDLTEKDCLIDTIRTAQRQALRTCTHTKFKAFNFLRKLSPEAYYYICKTDEILKTI